MGKDGQLREVTINTPQDAVKYGIGYLSEDRRRYGCVVQKSVTENTTLATMEEYTSGLLINQRQREKSYGEIYSGAGYQDSFRRPAGCKPFRW